MTDALQAAWRAALLLVVVPGCGDSADTTRLSGKVTVAGQTLAGGLVNFFPAAGGRPLACPLDENGTYQIDIPPGDYRVVVQASTQLPAGWQEGDPVPPPRVQVPTIYSQPQRTPLTANVVAGPEVQKTFELK